MSFILKLSQFIKYCLEKIAFSSGWLLVVLMCVTCIDVIGRKFGIPVPLTKFQELEWHLRTTVFSTWMGYNYVVNAHPRVDSYTEAFSFKQKAWVELIGCVLFAMPFMAILSYFSIDFFMTSFVQNERSENALGLDARWIIKGIFVLGLWMVLLAVFSVMLRLIAFLFGGRSQEEVDLQIGHSELEV